MLHIQTHFHSFHLFNKYLESTFCVAGTLLSAAEYKTERDKETVLKEISVWKKKTDV